MLKKIIQKITRNKAGKELSFFDLSSREQKKLVVEATKRANKDQLKLVKEYDRKFGSLQTNSCK
ncbi:MAG TPA: hypothetical protein DCX32_04430 [Candidatus Moranbacteria bacterium]|nr:MAG: hypothetical protein UW87_C0002G0024 [Candidatus Moranbacteria bacterium GW2011_GWC2_45_10]KKT95194.1 MAG: hypothetical protein UW95_C0003G0036 [Parcubacteria group bacterium GW2011_GWC1_45_14]HAV11754.1 hypothetical protein [Candidatus Moranbacteria bacterium]